MNRLTDFLTRYRNLVAPLAGVFSAFGFEPWGLWPVTLICFALLIWLTAQAGSKKQAFLTGWLFGVGHFCWGLQWIAIAFTYQGAMPAWLGYVSVFLLSLYLAVYPGLTALGAWWVGTLTKRGISVEPPEQSESESRNMAGRIALPYILAFAAFWIITEWLRSWVFTGFAWNPLSVVAVDSGPLSALPAVGTYGNSALVIILAALTGSLFVGLTKLDWRITIRRLADMALLAIAAWLLGLIGNASDNLDLTQTAITIVQPNINQEQRYDPLEQDNNIRKIAALSPPLNTATDATKAKNEGRILFWSESAMPWRLEDDYPLRFYFGQPGDSARESRKAIADKLLGPNDILLTGNDRLRFDDDDQLIGAHNSVVAMNGKGDIIDWYDKAHLVPYGEYLALRWVLEPLGAARLVPGDIDFWPGPGPRTLNLGTGKPKAGIQVCYEIIFSGQVVDRNNRPDFLFNPSNDAWFGDVGPPQHLAQARLRAIEEGLPVIRSTPTGVSAIIGADGYVQERLELGTSGRIDALLPAAHAPTLFSRYGNILPMGFALLLLAFALFPVARSRFAR